MMEGGFRMSYVISEPPIHAMEPVYVEECPAGAIYFNHDAPTSRKFSVDDKERCVSKSLPGQDKAVGSPGGATGLDAVRADTELVASHSGGDFPPVGSFPMAPDASLRGAGDIRSLIGQRLSPRETA
jgi:hypothetical protein